MSSATSSGIGPPFLPTPDVLGLASGWFKTTCLSYLTGLLLSIFVRISVFFS